MPESVEPFDQGVAVLGRIGDLRQVGDRGDAGIERAQRTGQVADIGVLGTIVIGRGAGNVAEIVREHSVRQHVAQRALIEMMVRVDEARQHDHARRVDCGRVGANIRAHGDDLLVLDQDVRLLEVSDGGIEAQHHAALTGYGPGRAGRKRAARCRPPPSRQALPPRTSSEHAGSRSQRSIAAIWCRRPCRPSCIPPTRFLI